MGLNDKNLQNDAKIVPLFTGASVPGKTPSSGLSPFFDLALAFQNAFVTYNLGLLKATAEYARKALDSCSPPAEKPPRIIVADKEWLSDQAVYAPFLHHLETEGYHEIASYNVSAEQDGDGTAAPNKIVYWINVMQGGSYAHIFHGDAEGREGRLLELSWQEEAGAYAVALYDVRGQKPAKVEEIHIFDQTCDLLSALVPAINLQNRQARSRPNGDPPSHLHLVS